MYFYNISLSIFAYDIGIPRVLIPARGLDFSFSLRLNTTGLNIFLPTNSSTFA